MSDSEKINKAFEFLNEMAIDFRLIPVGERSQLGEQLHEILFKEFGFDQDQSTDIINQWLEFKSI